MLTLKNYVDSVYLAKHASGIDAFKNPCSGSGRFQIKSVFVKSSFVINPFSGWHFARQQVAARYLKTLSSGVMLSTTIQAPAKTGLTSFLINDVIPCAADAKFVTVYVDLSDPEVPISAAVITALERVLSGSSAIHAGFNLFKSLFLARHSDSCSKEKYVQKIQIVDKNYFLENREKNLELIKSYFQKILSYKSVLILVDHADQLTHDDIALEFCEYFKELITKNSQAIRPLYATSNKEAWSGVFENRHSPLYSEGAFVHKLPALSKNFVRDAVLRSGLNISMDEGVTCYEMAGERPGIFSALLLGWDPLGNSPITSYFHQQLFPPVPKKLLPAYAPLANSK